MLSNIVFVIILILLVIILVLLYFFSNDIRKNKNKINICESDIISIRDRLHTINQKIINIENDISNENITKQKSNNIFEQKLDPSDITGLLSKIGDLNNNFFNDGNNFS